jgi:hypothetical protein
VTAEEAITELEAHFGGGLVSRRSLGGGETLVAVGPLTVPGRADATTRVGLRLPDEISAQPPVYIDNLDLRLPNGQLPNNASDQFIEGEAWRMWSMQGLWTPVRPVAALVLMTIERWSRDS